MPNNLPPNNGNRIIAPSAPNPDPPVVFERLPRIETNNQTGRMQTVQVPPGMQVLVIPANPTIPKNPPNYDDLYPNNNRNHHI